MTEASVVEPSTSKVVDDVDGGFELVTTIYIIPVAACSKVGHLKQAWPSCHPPPHPPPCHARARFFRPAS